MRRAHDGVTLRGDFSHEERASSLKLPETDDGFVCRYGILKVVVLPTLVCWRYDSRRRYRYLQSAIAGSALNAAESYIMKYWVYGGQLALVLSAQEHRRPE